MSAASSGRSRSRRSRWCSCRSIRQKSQRVREVADRLYAELNAAGIEVLYDDRDARPGVKFADAELLGIPHRVVVGERGLDAGKLEYRHRRATESEAFALDDALPFVRSVLGRRHPESLRLPVGPKASPVGIPCLAENLQLTDAAFIGPTSCPTQRL